jgi:PAS domain S-box-containing protein
MTIRVDRQDSIEERFRSLVMAISDYAIYLLDINGNVASWNAGAERYKGYTADEIIGQHFSRFYTPEDRAAGTPTRALLTAAKEGRFEAEGWRVRKDGSRFWASVVIDAVRNDAHKIVGFAKVTRDITDKKRAEDALRESEQRFRLLIQGVTDYAIYMLSPSGEITNWNSGAERIKQYSSSDVIGKHFSLFYTEEERAKGMPQRALAIAAEKGRYENEGVRIRKDKTEFWAHVVIDAIHDEDGELIGFAKITRDITERRQAAKALDEAKDALFQSQKMEAIGQLTGGISHDFNNLLAVIANSLDILSIKGLVPEASHLVESMRRAVDRGSLLTQQLLAFARQQPLKPELINVNELISSFESVLVRAGKINIQFEFSLSPDLCLVMIDGPRLEAAILNLVVNARDAMEEGGTISVSTRNIALADGPVGKLPLGDYALIEVRDTGSGMPPEVIARAFDPFFTTKGIGKGTGLGLSQVYGFITQSGGDVVISSEVGRGTNVAIYLPAKAADRSIAKDVAAPETVLVVEDEPDLLAVAAELFEHIGYRVLRASNGAEALALLESEPGIALLFSDVMMPGGMNGVELAKAGRARIPDLKVLLASGYPVQALRKKHEGIDEFAFVAKPYRLTDLTSKVRAIVH